MEKLGVATVISLPDPDKGTEKVYESDLLADLKGEDGESPPPSEQPAEDSSPEDRSELSPTPALADAIRYDTGSRPWLYAVAALVLAVLAAVSGRLMLRRGRLSRIRKLPPLEQVTELYPSVLRALELCGLPPTGANSPMEYCAAFGVRIQRILGEEADFTELTGVFERAFYGGIAPSEGECAAFAALARRLPVLCRRYVGPLRYPVVFFNVK